jgi:hypothetical protein
MRLRGRGRPTYVHLRPRRVYELAERPRHAPTWLVTLSVLGCIAAVAGLVLALR